MVTREAEARVRREVADAVGLADVPEAAWSRADGVEVERCASARGTERKRGIKELAADIQDDIRRAHSIVAQLGGGPDGGGDEGSASGGGRTVRRTESTPALGGYERDRGRALSLIVADEAEAWADWWGEEDIAHELEDRRSFVRAFREDALGDVLSPERARAFVRSPAARIRRWRPRDGSAPPPARVDVEVEEAGIVRDDRGRERQRVVLLVGPDQEREERGRPARLALAPPEIGLPLGAGGRDERVGYWEGSVLGALHKLAQRLAGRYPWREGEAAWFVVTGAVPRLPPIRARYELREGDAWQRAVLTLEVEPWVSATTVERHYRRLRRQVLPDDPRRGQALAVWLLSREEGRAGGRPPAGPALLARWNELHPGDRYKGYRQVLDARKRGEAFAGSIAVPGYAPRIGRGRPAAGAPATPIATPNPADDGG